MGKLIRGAASWLPLTSFSNSWVNDGSGNYNDLAVTKTSEGIVQLRGAIKSGTTTPGTLMFTLPAGFWPPKAIQVIGVSGVGASAIVMRVGTTGGVTLQTIGDATLTLIDGTSFGAA